MSKKLEHVFRKGPLSSEEVAQDKEVRRKIEAEFPLPGGRESGRLSRALQDALKASNRSIDEIAKDAGVSQVVVSSFLSGQRDIHMATADKLAEALGLKLAPAS